MRIRARLRHASPVKPARLRSRTFSCRMTSAFPSPSGSPLSVRRESKMRERIRGKKRRGVARTANLFFRQLTEDKEGRTGEAPGSCRERVVAVGRGGYGSAVVGGGRVGDEGFGSGDGGVVEGGREGPAKGATRSAGTPVTTAASRLACLLLKWLEESLCTRTPRSDQPDLYLGDESMTRGSSGVRALFRLVL